MQSNVTGGTLPYTYSWNNGYTTPDITGLAAGTYSLTVTDDNGSVVSQTIQVNQSPELIVSADVNDVLCYGASTGSIQLNISGGTPTYTYDWNNGSTSSLITGLSGGTYIYTVTDKLGCESSDTINLLESPEMVIMLNSTDVLCNGGNNGAISTTISGGTLPYTYSWNNGLSDADINSLSAGMYVLTVVDDNGCEAVDSIEIIEPADLDLVLSSTDVSCYGEATGSVQSNVSGGTSPYTYSWANGYSTADISGLNSGSYALTVTDDNGCVNSKTIIVDEASELIVSADVNDVLCNGASSGSIQLNVSGGTPTYTYDWDNGLTSSLINGLSGGTYIYTVTDKLGCESSDTINLLESSDMNIAFSATDVLCYGGNNGAISTTITGGALPYTYSWNNGSSDADINNLSAGMYVLTVLDDNACEAVDSIEITEPSDMIVLLDSTDVLCNGGASGSIQTNVSGGTSPYTYSWDNGYSTSDISGLTSGTYALTVTDDNGCQFISTVFVDEPNEMILDLDTVNVLCYGYSTGSVQSNITGGTSPYTYSWNNGYSSSGINNLAIGSYTLTVTDENGCSSVAVAEVTQTNEIIIDASIDSVLCENEDIGSIDISVSGGTGPYEYIWSNNQLTQDIGNLSPGVYDLTVKDLNNCIKSENFIISDPPPFNVQLSQDTFVCEGENVILNASGGGTYEWSNGSASSSIEILASQSATYIVTVTSGLGCIGKDSTTVNIWNNPDANAGEDTTIYVGMSTTLSGSGGVSYSWTPEDFLDCPSCPDPISTPDNDMEYILWVTDANGCMSSDTIWVFIDSKTNLFVPNAFSPNMDGFNDEFKVYGNNIEDLQLVVYDRWGEMVFQTNDQEFGWDGTYKGKELNNATFVYILKARTAEGDDIVKKGDINLLK